MGLISRVSSRTYRLATVFNMSTGAIDMPKTKAHKRYLENREAKLVENDKTCLFLRGGNSSDAVTKVMSTLYSFKKPNAVQFHQKNMLRPFEDHSSLEFFAQRNDTSHFVFGGFSTTSYWTCLKLACSTRRFL